MKLLDRTLVNLSSKEEPDRLGHISLYRLNNNNLYYVYFIEARYFGCQEVEYKTNTIIKDERISDDYHYSIDLFFNDKNRYLGWDRMFGGDFMTEGYQQILAQD